VAQKISVTFACDYDSREIPEGEHLTRAFSLDGRDYEIDLCEKHSQKFDEVLSRFAEKARKVTNRVGKPKRRTTAHRQRMPTSGPGRNRAAWTSAIAAGSRRM